MHGGMPVGAHEFHILVELYDSKTGARITNAKVSASAAPLGSTSSNRPLEALLMAGTIAYFTLAGVRIEIPGHPVLYTVFEYQHGVS